MDHVYIIAEAGVNHNGDMELAKKLIDVAADAGVDAVKFQTFKTENLVTVNATKADYQKATTDKDESQFAMIKKLEIDEAAHLTLMSYCESKKIQFLSSPFDLDSIDLLVKLNLPLLKVPSGEITNYPYLKKIAASGKPVIVSTGMCELHEVKEALSVLTSEGLSLSDITVLHCNTEYPTPMEDVNLLAMKTMETELGVKVGYSDHTLGVEIPTAAVALGAQVIEKHFTLDKEMEGPDHKASLDPKELTAMVSAIRNIEKSLGHGKKQPSQSEVKNMPIARKSLVAKRAIKKGESFSEDNLAIKRPGDGISPMKWSEYIGQTASRDYQADELI